MSSTYPVPAGQASVELRFKNSRFIGFAAPANSVETARAFLSHTKEIYPDASHHVYAFGIGFGDNTVHGMSDDGEPAGTAGRPVLAVVRGAEIGDLVVVIVRYFGGTKLGTGGLVKAYTATAQAVLAELPTQPKVTEITAKVRVPYELHESCRALVQQLGGKIAEESFGTDVDIQLRVDELTFPRLRESMANATSGKARLERTSTGNSP